jgi:hypothetical protein
VEREGVESSSPMESDMCNTRLANKGVVRKKAWPYDGEPGGSCIHGRRP